LQFGNLVLAKIDGAWVEGKELCLNFDLLHLDLSHREILIFIPSSLNDQMMVHASQLSHRLLRLHVVVVELLHSCGTILTDLLKHTLLMDLGLNNIALHFDLGVKLKLFLKIKLLFFNNRQHLLGILQVFGLNRCLSVELAVLLEYRVYPFLVHNGFNHRIFELLLNKQRLFK
jgi:hypothetical protein